MKAEFHVPLEDHLIYLKIKIKRRYSHTESIKTAEKKEITTKKNLMIHVLNKIRLKKKLKTPPGTETILVSEKQQQKPCH